MINLQAGQDCFGFVVRPLNQFLAALRAVGFSVQHAQMVGCAALDAHPAAAQPIHQHLIVHVEVDNAVYGREKRGLRRLLKRNGVSEATFFGLVVNFFFSIFEFIGGAFTGSAAIMSDAIHDLGDALSLGFSIYFGRKAKRGPDKKFTYGYSRFSVLGVFVTTVILAIGAAFMIFISVFRITTPTDIDLKLMLYLSIIGLVLNTLASFRTENGRFNVIKAIEQKSVNGILVEDVIGWAIVLIGTRR